MNQPAKPAPKLITQSVYVLLDDDSTVLPGVECKFVTEGELPPGKNYFVVTKDGVQLHKDNTLLSATLPSDGIKSLGSLRTKARIRVPRIPGIFIARAHEFFQKVFTKYRAESEVMLMYHKDKAIWDIWCPEPVSYTHLTLPTTPYV